MSDVPRAKSHVPPHLAALHLRTYPSRLWQGIGGCAPSLALTLVLARPFHLRRRPACFIYIMQCKHAHERCHVHVYTSLYKINTLIKELPCACDKGRRRKFEFIYLVPE
jgi:hypothetical protein